MLLVVSHRCRDSLLRELIVMGDPGDILGWNLQLITSHLTVLPPAPPGEAPRAPAGWHRDGGTSVRLSVTQERTLVLRLLP